MAHGLSYYLRKAWKKPNMEELRKRMIEWRASNAIARVEHPLRLDRAHALGYKAKNGVFVVRVRILRGGHKRPRPTKGRRSKRITIRRTLKLNYKEIAEQKAARKYTNCEVVNSYWIGKDGEHYFFEVILADRNSPEVKADKELKNIISQRGRVFHGLTSAGTRARGLHNSIFKVPKARPSLRANNRKGN
jgi:large subunit ribosomal protein L15e